MTCFDHCVLSMLFRLHFVFTKFELVLRILLGIHSASWRFVRGCYARLGGGWCVVGEVEKMGSGEHR